MMATSTGKRFQIEHEEDSQWAVVDTKNRGLVLGSGDKEEEMQKWADELNAMTPEELTKYLTEPHRGWPLSRKKA